MTDDKRVDESWKEKAKAEQEAAAEPAGPPPPADFASLVSSLAASALLALGAPPEEGAPAGPPDLDRAKYAIDLLGVLEEKTQGRLTPEEGRHLAAVLHQLRLAFVETSRRPPPPPAPGA